MGKRTNQLQDPTLKTELIAVFGSLKQFAKAAAIPYNTVHRVTSGRPCSDEEISAVLAAAARFNPEAVNGWVESVPRDPEFTKLYLITLDLYAALKKADE